ncbi:pseudouridine synthase [Athelia psychrophila]|uniref:21S rRNA pseudouridine(2819) synthase n=1 Tax=Athelia psychrophila TaxID=1759441 RepID=A0A166R749_9AGAM|nr:pseudouridine synthase [Fibularhizoctonia sp. CBS 109695]
MLPRLSIRPVSRVAWPATTLYADRGVIVLNKPPGLICQTSPSSQDVDPALPKDDFSQLLDDLKGVFDLPKQPYHVHRLDKATTGTLVLAKNDRVARELCGQFENRTVDKTYLALVRGGRKSFAETSGEIREPLDFADGYVSLGSTAKAKFAATDWELVGSSPKAPLSLLRLKLRTGLKHQLRVHLSHCLHTPILGDTVYTKSLIHQQIRAATTVPHNRLFLHASNISFHRYNKTGAKKRFLLGVTSPMPRDFLRICMDAGLGPFLDKKEVEGGLFADGEPVDNLPDVEGTWMT